MSEDSRGKARLWFGKRVHLTNAEWCLQAGLSVAKIAFGYDHCAFLCDDKTIYMAGENSCGQLGLGHENRVQEPTQLEFPSGESRFH